MDLQKQSMMKSIVSFSNNQLKIFSVIISIYFKHQTKSRLLLFIAMETMNILMVHRFFCNEMKKLCCILKNQYIYDMKSTKIWIFDFIQPSMSVFHFQTESFYYFTELCGFLLSGWNGKKVITTPRRRFSTTQSLFKQKSNFLLILKHSANPSVKHPLSV